MTYNQPLRSTYIMCRRQMMSECRKSSRLLRWLDAGICTDFWLGSYTFIEFWRARSWEVSDIWKRKKFAKFWRFLAKTVLEVARLVFFLCLWKGISAKWGTNRPKTPQNHSRRQRKTKLSKLYLSDCHFGDEMFRFAVFMKHLSGSLPSSRDRRLQITNNVKVQLAYQISDDPQGCLPVVLLWNFVILSKVDSAISECNLSF